MVIGIVVYYATKFMYEMYIKEGIRIRRLNDRVSFHDVTISERITGL